MRSHLSVRSRFVATLLPLALIVGGCASSDDEAEAAAQAEVNAAAFAQNPKVGHPDRVPFMKAVHKKLDPQLNGQTNEYLVSWLQSKSGWTFIQADIRGKNGKVIDWKNTAFKSRIASNDFEIKKAHDGTPLVTFTALAKKNAAGVYEVKDVIVGSFIVGDWAFAPGVPESIRPFPLLEGDGDGGEGDGDGDGDGEGG